MVNRACQAQCMLASHAFLALKSPCFNNAFWIQKPADCSHTFMSWASSKWDTSKPTNLSGFPHLKEIGTTIPCSGWYHSIASLDQLIVCAISGNPTGMWLRHSFVGISSLDKTLEETEMLFSSMIVLRWDIEVAIACVLVRETQHNLMNERSHWLQ